MDKPVFVARERELDQLSTFLAQAQAEKGQVCFIAGDAGSGKTALISEFARRALEADPELMLVYGTCNAQTGISDPYLPFREVLGQFTGQSESRLAQGIMSPENASRLQKILIKSVQVLVEVGPDLIDALVPGSGLIGLVGKTVAEKVGWTKGLEQLSHRLDGTTMTETTVEQSRIFEQYTRFLLTLAEQHPIVLVLDDLHWGDAASISLLFHLGRRIGESRILIIGAYRPADVAYGLESTVTPAGRKRHPLVSVLDEFKRYYGDIWIDLGQTSADEGRHFVDAILDTETNRLDEAFRQALFQHTGGYALFTVELLRDLQDRGDLVQDQDSAWVVADTIDWQTLPIKIEGVIEKRIKRLKTEWQDLLTVASVEGETFTAEVTARVEACDVRELVHLLSRELDRTHHLVAAQGLERVGSQRLSRYRFRHNLFQRYLYQSLDELDRGYLHEDVGNALEALFADHTEAVAVQLAWHFQEAGLIEKAVFYHQSAGDGAARAYAYTEAIAFYRQGLALVKEHAVCQDCLTDLYGSLGRMLELNSQFAEAMAVYEEMLRLAQELGDRPMELAALMDQITLYITPTPIHDPVKGPALGLEALALARELQDQAAEAKTLWNLSLGGMWSGHTTQGIAYAEEAVALSRKNNLTELLAYSLNDLGMLYTAVMNVEQAIPILYEAGQVWRTLDNLPMLADNISMTAMAHVAAGDYEQAISQSDEAFQLSVSHNNLWGESYSRMMVCYAYWELGYPDQALTTASESVRLGKLAGFMASQVMAGGFKAWFLGNLGAVDEGLAVAREAADMAKSHFPHFRCHPVGILAQLHLMLGDLDAAQELVEQARADAYRDAHPNWNMRINVAEAELALRRADNETAIAVVDRWLPKLCQYKLRAYTPAMLHIKGKALLALDQPTAARERIREAISIADEIGAKATLWPLLIDSSDLEPNPAYALQLNTRARTIVDEMANHISSTELRQAFLNQPHVHSLLST